MKSVLPILAAALFAFVPSASAQTTVPRSGVTVAYISGQRIAAESVAGKEAQGRLTALRQQKATELQQKRRALDGTRQALAGNVAADERVRLERQEQQEEQDLERSTQQAQLDVQNLQRQIAVDLQPQVRSILDELLKGTDVQVVLQYETSIVWAADGLDLTSAVIERMNAKSTGEKKPDADGAR